MTLQIGFGLLPTNYNASLNLLFLITSGQKEALATALGAIRGLFFIPEPKKLARNEKIVLYLWRYKHITHLFLLSGNDNPYRNIDDCLAMGHARETWRKIYGRDVVCL